MHSAADAMPLRVAPGLRAQLLRAASSVSANIAEGAGKRSEAEFARYLDIALGSARELENHLLLARDLGCGTSAAFDQHIEDVDEVKRIVFSLARAVRRRAALGEALSS